jgi:hypothetical protein
MKWHVAKEFKSGAEYPALIAEQQHQKWHTRRQDRAET